MNEIEFINSLKIVCTEIYKNKTNVSSKDLKNVRLFMDKNPTNPNVILFKNRFIDLFQKQFLNPEFINALNIQDNEKYRKKQEVLKHFPLKYEEFQYRLYFYALFQINDSIDIWTDCINFFKKEGKCNIEENIIDKFITFKNNNLIPIKSNKDNYLNYETELNLYKQLLLGITTKDFYNFKNSLDAKDKYSLSDYEILKKYEYKKIGNIGELYIYEKVKHMPNAIFTAKDIGNGFGFDIYYQNYNNLQIIENLVEVKTTANLNGDDYIELSENEYNIMMNTLNDDNVNYYVCRIFIDTNKDNFEYYFLKLDGNTLKDENNNIEYEMNQENKHIFKRKQKVLTLNK